jgi:hypothetical protein
VLTLAAMRDAAAIRSQCYIDDAAAARAVAAALHARAQTLGAIADACRHEAAGEPDHVRRELRKREAELADREVEITLGQARTFEREADRDEAQAQAAVTTPH